MPGADPARRAHQPAARPRAGVPPPRPSSWGSDPRSANAAPPPDTPRPRLAPSGAPPPSRLARPARQNQPVLFHSHGHPCRSAPRSRPPPPPRLIVPGWPPARAPRGWRARGTAGTAPPPLTSDSAQEQEAPQKRHGGGRAVRGVCRGRGCGRRCGSPGASRAPDWLPAAAPLHLRATPPSLRR